MRLGVVLCHWYLHIQYEFRICRGHINQYSYFPTMLKVLMLSKQIWHRGGNRIVVANAGDSRAVLSRNGTPIVLSREHKPNTPSEMERLKSRGVVSDSRLYGTLSITRAFGDKDFKTKVSNYELCSTSCKLTAHVDVLPIWDSFLFFLVVEVHQHVQFLSITYQTLEGTLIADPEVIVFDLKAQDEFIIMASDGFWDVITNEEVIPLTNSYFQMYKRTALGKVVQGLVEEAHKRGSSDDITVLLLILKVQYEVERSNGV